MFRVRTSVGALALAAAAGLSACSKDKSPTAVTVGASTTYAGLVSGAAVTGTLAITFPSPVASVVGGTAFNASLSGRSGLADAISATLQIVGGGTVSLTGTYTAPNLTLSGGGWTFTGTVANGAISGTFTGPSGPGGFEALSSPSGSPARVMCGTSTGTSWDGSPDNASFNLVVGSGVFLVVDADGVAWPRGTYQGSTFDTYTLPGLNFGTFTATITVHGTIGADGTTASGSYSFTGGGHTWGGSWQAGHC